MRDMVARGDLPDSHRWLRLVSKLGTGLGATSVEGVDQAASRMFAALGWMESLCEGSEISVGRTGCSMVSIFHRRGFTDLALQALRWLRQRSQEIPVCTLSLGIDLCLQDDRLLEARELFREVRLLIDRMLAAPLDNLPGHYKESVKHSCMDLPRGQFDEDDNPDQDDGVLSRSNSGANYSPSMSAKAAPGEPPVMDKGLCTDGLPNWLSAREGYLMALIAGHVSVLNRLAPVDPGHWKDWCQGVRAATCCGEPSPCTLAHAPRTRALEGGPRVTRKAS